MKLKQYRTAGAIMQRIEDLVVESAIDFKVLKTVRMGKLAMQTFNQMATCQDPNPIIPTRVDLGGFYPSSVSSGKVELVVDLSIPPYTVEAGEETTDGSIQL